VKYRRILVCFLSCTTHKNIRQYTLLFIYLFVYYLARCRISIEGLVGLTWSKLHFTIELCNPRRNSPSLQLFPLIFGPSSELVYRLLSFPYQLMILPKEAMSWILKLLLISLTTNPHSHDNTLCSLPKFCINFCFQLLLGMFPRELENNSLCKFVFFWVGGQSIVIMGMW